VLGYCPGARLRWTHHAGSVGLGGAGAVRYASESGQIADASAGPSRARGLNRSRGRARRQARRSTRWRTEASCLEDEELANLTQDRSIRRGHEPVAPAHDRRHDGPADCVEDPARLPRTLNGEADAIGDAVIVVSKTRSSEQAFCSPPRGSLWPVRPERRCDAHSVEVVASDIFATPNSLKSHLGRKLKSPFSNIHAVTSKLCRHSRPTAGENHT
jgi:hypothetical protein